MENHKRSGDVLTTAALGSLAFITADLGHESLGHGAGFMLAGGRTCILTTTRIIESQRLGDRGGDIFDLGGPAGNIAFAGIAWMILRLLRKPQPHFRLFLWLLSAFSLFWAFGYLLYSGLLAKGDYVALIRGLPHTALWRLSLCIPGAVLYFLTFRYLAARRPPGTQILTGYLAGGCVACCGAVLDPWGPMEVLNSAALSSFVAPVGLLIMARLPTLAGKSKLERSTEWIIAAFAATFLYVVWLGPGISIAF